MNLAVLPENLVKPASHLLLERALEPHILLGMPHLTPDGLSETWLMKELGHRHWLMLARHRGMDNADFRTESGEEVYAAICATSVRQAAFNHAKANHVLTIRSTLSPVSRTQVATRHHLAIGSAPIGEVELVSVFVTRTNGGGNQSLVRVSPFGPVMAARDNTLAGLASRLRAGKLESHFGLPIKPEKSLRVFSFDPSLSQEFNGAGLFYCTYFQALIARAMDQWFPRTGGVADRDVFFLGNIDPGETVHVELTGINNASGAFSYRILRSDNALIGLVFSKYISADF